MNFDRIAPHYRWLEFLFAGRTLQDCRIAWLDEVKDCRSVLIVGEGDGRFLMECAARLPNAYITCVDGSAGMLEQTRRRCDKAFPVGERFTFIHAVLPEWEPPEAQFDLIVTHFFLDCFSAGPLKTVVASLARAARPEAFWLLADFQIPAKPPAAKLRARIIIATAYAFFRIAAGLNVSKLIPPDGILENHGFTRQQNKTWSWGMLYSSLWRGKAGISQSPDSHS